MEQDRLWQGREVARALAKALDAAGRATTPSADPCAEFGRSLRTFVRHHGRFQLRVAARGLRLGSEALADDQGRFAGLARRLLVGGVCELTVDPGVTEEEVQLLLEALGTEDAAMAVLELGLEHVELTSLEFVPRLARPDAYSAEARNALQELQKKGDAAAKELEAKGALATGLAVYELTDSGGEFLRVDKVPPPAPVEGQRAPAAPATEAVVALRARILESSRAESVLLALVDTVLEGLAVAPRALGPDHAKWFLELAPDQALRDGDLPVVAAMLERLTQELKLLKGPAAAAVQGILQAYTSERGRERLIAVGASGSDPAAFCAILRALGEHGVPTALTTWQRTRSKELKDALGAFLAERISAAPAALEPLLQPSASVETAKFALFLVSRGLEGALADAFYDLGRAHPEQAVSQYATFLWRTHTARGRLAALLESLEKNDVADRITVVNLLAQAKDQPALPTLMKVVQDPSFFNRTPEEMDAFLKAIAAIGGQETLAFFEQQAARSSGLFRMRAGTELRGKAKSISERLRKQEP